MNSTGFKNSKTRLLLIVFVVLCVVFGLLTIQSKHILLQFPRQHAIAFSEKSLPEQAKINELEGVMYKADYIRKEQLLTIVRRGGVISDSDLSWIFQMLKSPGPSSNATVSDIRRAQFFEVLLEIDHYTPLQEEMIFQTMTIYVMNSNTTDELWSMGIFKHLKDARAVTYLTPLLNSTNPAVRRKAARVIKILNSQHSG